MKTKFNFQWVIKNEFSTVSVVSMLLSLLLLSEKKKKVFVQPASGHHYYSTLPISFSGSDLHKPPKQLLHIVAFVLLILGCSPLSQLLYGGHLKCLTVLVVSSEKCFLFSIQICCSPTASLLWEGAELHHPPGAVPVLLGGIWDGESLHTHWLCEQKFPGGCSDGKVFLNPESLRFFWGATV